MSKKRKSKKHRGFKDPLSNQKQKFEKIKDKINSVPRNPDVQEMPKVFQSIQAALEDNRIARNQTKEILKERKKILLSQHNATKGLNKQRYKTKQNQAQKIRKKKLDDLIDTAEFIDNDVGWYPHNGRPFKPIPTLQQLPNESFSNFKKRVNKVTNSVHYESKFEEMYNVDVVRDESGKVVEIVKLHDEKSLLAKQKKSLKAKERRLKLKLRKNKSKIVKNSDSEDDDDVDAKEKKLFRNEKVEFGDIVHQPPTLNTEKLDKLINSKKKNNFLFLQNLRKETANNQPKKPNQNGKKATRDLEAERTAAVQAYRQLKLKTKSNVEMGMIT